MLKSFVEYIVKTLVEKPEAVQVAPSERDGKQVLVISVDKSDMGRVIGKDGLTIKAIRTCAFAVQANDKVDDIVIDDTE